MGPDFAAATWRNVLIAVWRGPTLVEDAEKVQEHLEAFRRWHPQGVFLLTIVHEHAPPPEREAREAIAKYLDAGKDYIVAGAVIMDGDSWRAACVRAVATSLSLIARPPFPFRVCRLKEAGELFQAEGAKRSVAFAAGHFPRAIHDLRQRIESELQAQNGSRRHR